MPDTKSLALTYVLVLGASLYALSIQSVGFIILTLAASLLAIWAVVNSPLLKGKSVGECADLIYFAELNSLPVLSFVVMIASLCLIGS